MTYSVGLERPFRQNAVGGAWATGLYSDSLHPFPVATHPARPLCGSWGSSVPVSVAIFKESPALAECKPLLLATARAALLLFGGQLGQQLHQHHQRPPRLPKRPRRRPPSPCCLLQSQQVGPSCRLRRRRRRCRCRCLSASPAATAAAAAATAAAAAAPARADVGVVNCSTPLGLSSSMRGSSSPGYNCTDQLLAAAAVHSSK
jgi:hypothetical protein